MADLCWLEDLFAGHPEAELVLHETRRLASRDRAYAAGLGVVEAEVELDEDLRAYVRGCVDLDRRAGAGELDEDQAEAECERLGKLLARTSVDTPERRALMVTVVFARTLETIAARRAAQEG